MLSMIVAMAENGTIGAEGKIPWRIPGEQAYFKQMTMGHPIVMGRKTFESIGKPLPGRPNYILTRDRGYQAQGCHVVHHTNEIVKLAETEDVFVIGGAEVYDLFFPATDAIYLTVVHRDYPGDTFFPPLDEDWVLVESHEGPSDVLPHTFRIYRRKKKA